MGKLQVGMLTVIAVVIGVSAAGAADVQLLQSGPSITHAYNGHAIDVRGIAPGMTVAEVRDKLAQVYETEPNEENATVGIQYKSLQVVSAPYLATLSAAKGDDSMAVYFAPPSTGAQVVGINRRLTFGDPTSAPTVKDTAAQLIQKYGEPSCGEGSNGVFDRLSWVYSAQTQTHLTSSSCGISVQPQYEPGAYLRYRNEVSAGQHLVIKANLSLFSSDPSRVQSLTRLRGFAPLKRQFWPLESR
jgi:hypothetical protein